MTPSPQQAEQQAIEQSRAELTWLGVLWHELVRWRASERPPAWGFAEHASFTRMELMGRCLFLQGCLRHYGVSSDLALRWLVPLALFVGAVAGLLIGRLGR